MSMKLVKKRLVCLLVLAVSTLGLCATPRDYSKATITRVQTLLKLFDRVTDSSQLPTWTGKKLKLKIWNAHGTGGAQRIVSPQDVISPELARIFGIEFDKNSFDNGGQDYNSKLSVLAASNDWPELVQGGEIKDLVQGNKLYELTPWMSKYAPHIWNLDATKSPRGHKLGWSATGKFYQLATCYNNDVNTMLQLYPELDLERFTYIAAPMDAQGWLCNMSVRDDILKKLYPNAKTQKEIEALYLKNGKFTREEIYDVPLKSKADVVKFLYDLARVIKENNITENGVPVNAFPVFAGQDNWALCSWILPIMNGKAGWNYFTQYDPKTKRIEYQFSSPSFKEDLRLFNKMVRDGVAPKESLIDNNEIFTNKFNNGEYAVSYAWMTPDANRIAAAKKTWNFRKVYMDIPQNTKEWLYPLYEPQAVAKYGIFKDKVSEADLPQVMAFFDFMQTPVGMKLACWGPKTAGFWKQDAKGNRKFVNKDVEDCLVYGKANGINEKYNLCTDDVTYNGTCPAYPGIAPGVKGGGIYNPKYTLVRDKTSRAAGEADKFFANGIYDQVKPLQGSLVATADFWNFPGLVPAAKTFWDARGTGFEPLMTRCFAAKDDAEFEKAFKAMVDFATENGLTKETLDQINKAYAEKYPDDLAIYRNSYK